MDKKEAIAKAREKVKGKDTLKMHRQKLVIALSWIDIFHWSAPRIIDYIVHNSCKTGFASRLEKQGLVMVKQFPPQYYLPKKMLMLSRAGREMLAYYRKDTIPWTGKPPKTGHIWHDYLVQICLARKFKQNPHIAIATNAKVGHKIYDATYTIDNKKTGVEVEISRKKKHEVANMLFYVTQNFKVGKIHKVEIYYDGETIKNQFLYFIQDNTKNGICTFQLYKRYKGNGKYEKSSYIIQIPREQLNLEFIRLDIPPRLCEKKPLKIPAEVDL